MKQVPLYSSNILHATVSKKISVYIASKYKRIFYDWVTEVPAVLPSLPIEYEAGWAPDLAWNFCKTENSVHIKGSETRTVQAIV
jgi:hypothetical protein